MSTKCNVASGLDDNVWMEGRDMDNNVPGICLLDTMTEAQMVYVLQRDERARADLPRITTDKAFLTLADTVPRLPVVDGGDQAQSELNRQADSIPFYSQFRGQPPFAQ